jgi:prepilin-type N-terminal cleavage/methylation domain-containing protein
MLIMKNNETKSGFTLVEVMIAATVLVIAAAMCATGFVYVLRSTRQSVIQTQLDSQIQVAMERLKYDLRLSARDKMLYYPPGSGVTHTAVSFPVATNNAVTGMIDTDIRSNIIWGKTVIYHAWTAPFSNQLRVTTFSTRNTNDAVRQQQLADVVFYGDGSDPHVTDHANGQTEIIFENLFDWDISEFGGDYDGYAATTQRDVNYPLGTVILSPGNHTFTFTVISNNSSCVPANGYKIGIDSLHVSPCSFSKREAETQSVSAVSASMALQTNYMANGSWDGNYQLLFPATATNKSFTLTMANDRWEDTDFRGTGEICDKTDVFWDNSLSPMDYVVMLTGYGTNWTASNQTGDYAGTNSAVDELTNYACRVLVRGGSDMVNGGMITGEGAKCRVNFMACTTSALQIASAFIATNSGSSLMDAVNTGVRLTFGVASNYNTTINGGSSQWSNYTNFPICESNSYLVSFLVTNVTGNGNAYYWTETSYPSAPGCYMLPSSNASDARAAVWSTNLNVITTNKLFAVQYIQTTYPTNGTYTSEIFDTTKASPTYNQMSWNAVTSSTTSVQMRVRTGNSNDLSDTAGWSGWQNSAYTILTSGQYVQFQALLTPDANCISSPKLKDVAIGWAGDTKAVNISGTFTKGPDYGIFQLSVDGALLRKALGVTMSIYETAPVYGGGTNTLTSTLTEEVEPRNTGK